MLDNYSRLTRPRWIERPEAMARLEMLLIGARVPLVQLIGPPGSGKHSLAMYFASRHSGSFAAVFREQHLAHFSGRDRLDLGVGPVDSDYTLTIYAMEEDSGPGAEGLLERLRGAAMNQTLVVRRTPLVQAHAKTPSVLLEPLNEAQMTQLSLQNGTEQRLLKPFAQSGLLDPKGDPLAESDQATASIIALSSDINDEFLRRLDRDYSQIYLIHPRKFEELVAKLLERQGFTVELTPASADGGKDIYVCRTDIGSFLYLVECKQYAPDNPVGVSVVRELYGVVEAEKATAGIVATTSRFTKGAIEFQGIVKNRLSLESYIGIQQWIKKSLSGKKPK